MSEHGAFVELLDEVLDLSGNHRRSNVHHSRTTLPTREGDASEGQHGRDTSGIDLYRDCALQRAREEIFRLLAYSALAPWNVVRGRVPGHPDIPRCVSLLKTLRCLEVRSGMNLARLSLIYIYGFSEPYVLLCARVASAICLLFPLTMHT